jgi:hypothetical protein
MFLAPEEHDVYRSQFNQAFRSARSGMLLIELRQTWRSDGARALYLEYGYKHVAPLEQVQSSKNKEQVQPNKILVHPVSTVV